MADNGVGSLGSVTELSNAAEISNSMSDDTEPYLFLWAWWAKLAYQVMLTIRGRLITPFVLGSMFVGLNILIRHSFMDL